MRDDVQILARLKRCVEHKLSERLDEVVGQSLTGLRGNLLRGLVRL